MVGGYFASKLHSHRSHIATIFAAPKAQQPARARYICPAPHHGAAALRRDGEGCAWDDGLEGDDEVKILSRKVKLVLVLVDTIAKKMAVIMERAVAPRLLFKLDQNRPNKPDFIFLFFYCYENRPFLRGAS